MTRSHSPNWKWWVCGALLLATMLNYMDRQALPLTATELKARYGLSDDRYGLLEAFFSWAFALGAITFGLIADLFGPRRVYPVVLAGWSVAGLLTPLMSWPSVTDHFNNPDNPGSGPFLWLLGCRTVLGFFEAGHWPCALITARQILTAKDRAFGNGLLQSGASLGAILIPFYAMAIRNLGGGWEVVFWSIGAAGLMWMPLWFFLIRRGDLEGPPPPSAQDDAGDTSLGMAMFLRMVVTITFVQVSLTVSWQFLRAWLPKYLEESEGYSRDATGNLTALYFISADIGCLLSGLFVKWLAGRGLQVHTSRVIGFTLYSCVTASAAVIPSVGGGNLGIVLMMLAGFGILGLHPIYYSFVQELPARWMGVLSGGITAVGWFTAGFVQKTLGEHINETKSYDAGLMLAGLAPLVGLAAILLLWRPKRRSA